MPHLKAIERTDTLGANGQVQHQFKDLLANKVDIKLSSDTDGVSDAALLAQGDLKGKLASLQQMVDDYQAVAKEVVHASAGGAQTLTFDDGSTLTIGADGKISSTAATDGSTSMPVAPTGMAFASTEASMVSAASTSTVVTHSYSGGTTVTQTLNAAGQVISSTATVAQSNGATNADGSLSTSEAADVRLWAGLNENGTLDANELQGVGSSIKAADYGFYTRGNGRVVAPSVVAASAPAAPVINVSAQRPQAPTASAPGNSASASALPVASSFVASGMPAAPADEGVPASSYRSLRDTDNVYYPASGGYIAFTANMVKINNSTRNTLIGTDGADSFDSSAYADTGFFNNSLLVNFLGGGGNDEMGGSTRNERMRSDNDSEWRQVA